MNQTSESIPNSPQELIIKNKEFSLEEIENLIHKLDYSDQDNLIFHKLQDMKKFHIFLLKKSSEDKDLNPRELMKKITQLEIIIDLYKEI